MNNFQPFGLLVFHNIYHCLVQIRQIIALGKIDHGQTVNSLYGAGGEKNVADNSDNNSDKSDGYRGPTGTHVTGQSAPFNFE